MSRRNDSRTNRTAGHPAALNPVPSMRATVAVFGLAVAVLLTLVAPTAMLAAALTVGLGYVAVTSLHPQLPDVGIPVPGTGSQVRISSHRDCERDACEYAMTVAVVEKDA